MNTLYLLIFLFILVWFWQDSLRAREFAVKFCQDKCNEMGLQLLDQTVALKSISIIRNINGLLGISRRYNFEFSISGVNRYSGSILIQKDHVSSFQLEHPDGLLILNENELIRPH
jgi:hypothetical protein